MNTKLQEIILKKCRKKVTPLEPNYEEDEEEEMLDIIEEESDTTEELPYEDILAEKRRNYSAKEEFIFLLYNDVLKYFVKEWDGHFLRKKPRKKIHDDSTEISGEGEYYYDDNNFENIDECKEKNSNYYRQDEAARDWPWKLTLPDEYANITFINNNTYSGQVSRKMMEGKGVYRWSNGARYKGEFEQNRMHGKGLLEWNSVCWYEGDFVNSYRHGKGMMVDGDNRYMYTGQWFKGQRHGKGYCRYRDGGTYDGDWVMDKMDGIGLRIYPSGARYVGQWKNGIRHGIGTMVWTNGNLYRGEWTCGEMNGYGQYTWKGFLNKTFTWPQEASYTGYWRHGLRHGEGEMKLNSVGGARYLGQWKENKRHGYGAIIGNNGEKFESNPLFRNDVLCTADMMNDTSESNIEAKDEEKFAKIPNILAEAPVTPILKPEQCPCLSYYMLRLLDPTSLEPPFVPSISSGKCNICENESCSCLRQEASLVTVLSEQGTLVETDSIEISAKVKMQANWENEEHWTYNCLTLHMFHLRKIYKQYAILYAKASPNANVVMSRLCLWQLWRDCGIHEKGLSLNEIDNYMAKNEATFINDPCNPFERIEIWQFLHALLEVSWHLYTKYDNVDIKDMNGKIASGLHKFLNNDIYPYVGHHVGNLCYENHNLLPMHCVFELYRQTGYPPSAKDLLRVTCVLKGTIDSKPSSTPIKTDNSLPFGINTVTIGDSISYLLKLDGILASPHCTSKADKKTEINLCNKLFTFKQLGATKMVEIMTLICPGIKDKDSKIIMNIDYKLTFLEFYEILLEATKQLLCLERQMKKMAEAKRIMEEAKRAKELFLKTTTISVRGKGTSRIGEQPSTRRRV